MAMQVQISMDQYLVTSHQPDREYIDGELQERNAGKWEHARLQWLLGAWFARHESAWGVMGSMEQCTRVAVSRVRIPDIVIVPAGRQPDVLEQPPILVVEFWRPTTRTRTHSAGHAIIRPWALRLPGSSIPKPEAAACAKE